MRKLLLLLAILVGAAHAQNSGFYSNQATGVNPFSATPVFLSSAQVRVCTSADIGSVGTPCTHPAAITDIFGNPLTVVGGNFGQLTADIVGNYTFGCNPTGNFWVQIAASGNNTPQKNFPISCGSTGLIPGFITTPIPTIANSGFGAGTNTCASMDSNVTIWDAGCGAVTNLFTFVTPSGAGSFRHGWNYYFQTDMTTTANPIGWTLSGAEVIPAAGQTLTDAWSMQRSMIVSGGNASSAGTFARVSKMRTGVASGTTLNGTLMGETFYLPTIAGTLNGGLNGWTCDSPSVTGTFSGGYICFVGGTVEGSSLAGGTRNPAFVLNATGNATFDAWCWGAVSGASVFTATNCMYASTGTPNSVLTANFGSSYLDTTNGLSYIKFSGSGNTGWAQSVITPCQTSQKTETAADTNVLTCAIPAVVGNYRINFNASISAASAATLGWTATWTDSNGNAATPTNLPVCLASTGTCAATSGALSAVDRLSGVYVVDVNNAGTSIVIKLTFSGTSFTAKVSATVERVI